MNDVKLVRVSMEPYFNDNHVFVIIGDAESGTKLRDLGDVVFCDPWLAEAVARNPQTSAEHRPLTHGAFDKDQFLMFYDGFDFEAETNKITVMIAD